MYYLIYRQIIGQLDLNIKEFLVHKKVNHKLVMDNFNISTRKAILIGSPGPKDNHLEGVKIDLQNMKRFLLSEAGGAWNDEEISVLKDPTLSEILPYLESMDEDYLFVYFSGHGFTNTHGARMLSLRGHSIPDTLLLRTPSQKQLVVVDACRTFVSHGFSGIPEYELGVDHFEGSYARRIFDECISLSPAGKIIVHSTQSGYKSYENTLGGHFTQALLKISYEIQANDQYTTCAIDRIINHTPLLLRQYQNNQVPSITYRSGMLTIPFAIGIPSHLKVRSLEKRGKSSTEGIFTVVIVSLLVVAIVGAVASN
jgi:hypothetical protein